VVTQLLTEIDGYNELKDVYIIGATNRPDIIEKAMLRPGRLEKILYVPLPNEQDRVDILEKHLRKVPLEENLNIKQIALNSKCDRYSGADISSLVKEAQASCVRRFHIDPKNEKLLINQKDFDSALDKVVPSVSRKDMQIYDKVTLFILILVKIGYELICIK